MIRVWSTNTGTEIEAYSAPVEGSRRLAMSAAGTKIVSASPTGSIQIWKTEQPPWDTDIKFHVDENDVSCLSFSPDEQKLLICLEDEVQIWNWEARQKLGQVQSFGGLDTSFSLDGRFIIVGSKLRTTVWDVTVRDLVFDNAATVAQTMSFSDAKNAILTCGPLAHRMWPSFLRNSESISCPVQRDCSATELTVDNTFSFISFHFWNGI